MKEFIGRVTYPFLFSTSCRLVSAERLTHSSMFRTGILAKSFVKTLSGAVNFGVFGFSLLPALAFLDFGVAFGLGFGFGLSVLCCELEGTMVRPLLVRRFASSWSTVDLGVGGEPE
jgi:hypothetical protein